MKFLQEKQEFLEKGMSDLKQQLETEMEVFCCHVLLIPLCSTHTSCPRD